MKNNIKIFGITIMALSLLSCSKFLDENNPTGLSTIYTSEETLESAIVGIVQGFTSSWYGLSGEGEQFFNYASGITHWREKNYYNTRADYTNCMLYFSMASTNPESQGRFQVLYNTIARANSLLDNLASSPVNGEYKLEIEAETKFYRAVAYFFLVRAYGDCPLRIKTANATEATFCERTPYYKIYEQIVSDFEFAEKNMRSPQRVKEVTPQLARPNKFAATAYLSSVYLTIGSLLASPDDNFWNPSKEGRSPDFSAIGISKDDLSLGAKQAYTKALDYAEKLIPESAKHDAECTYKLVDKFGDLFNFNTNWSETSSTNPWLHSEQIFTIYNTIAGNGSSCPYAQYWLPPYAAGTDNDDNTQYGRARPTRWFFQKWCSTYPGNTAPALLCGGYATSSDPRLEKTMYYGVMEKNHNSSGVYNIYPAANNTDLTTVYPYLKKTASERGQNTSSDADLYIMRLAEVYLNAAEASAYLDDEAKARQYIEVLHARARRSVDNGQSESSMPSWSGKTFSNKEELLTEIFWESVFELYGEGHEYYNTHRHGARWIIKNISIPKNAFMDLSDNAEVKMYYYGSDYHYPEKYNDDPSDIQGDVFRIRKGLLMAFPSTELTYNSGITSSQVNDYTIE